MLTRLARKFTMLSGKMTLEPDSITLHKKLSIAPTWGTNYQMVRSRQLLKFISLTTRFTLTVTTPEMFVCTL
jgi:hypothetical protein